MRFRYYLLIIIWFCSQAAYAAQTPTQILQGTSQQLLAELKEHKGQVQQDPHYIDQLVDEILVPHVDLAAMAHSVIGRDAWRQANSTQRQEFMAQFKTLLVRTYGAALSSYKNQKIVFLPLRGGIAGQNRVQIESQIIQPNGPVITVSYRLLKKGQDWKVYDFSVDGISVIESFRSQFSNDLNQGGIAQLLAKLKLHNQGN